MTNNHRDEYASAGTNAVVLLTGGETGGLYSVVALTLAPHNQSIPAHSHRRHTEGYYVVAGTLAVTQADETRTLTTGESLLVQSGERHLYWNPTASPTTVLLIYRPGVTEAEAIALALGESGFT